MKKVTAILLAVGLVLAMAGCAGQGQNGDSASSSVNMDYTVQAQAIADALQNEDFSAVTAQFDAAMAASLPQEDLKAAWNQTIQGLGAYTGRGTPESAAVQNGCTVTVPEQYEEKIVAVQISFNSEGRVQGLFFSYREGENSGPHPAASLPQGVKEEQVTVAGEPSLPLQGVLTLPQEVKNPPVVILIQGSGQSDKDETIGANKPFQDIAWGLAEKGIATLRYDKRYMTYPQAGQQLGGKLTIYDEVLDDADAAIALLRQDGRVDPERIFVLGHSLGGMLMPYIAAQHPELAGGISMAGSLRPLWEIMYDQNMELADTLRPTLGENDQAVLEAQLQQLDKDRQELELMAQGGGTGSSALMGISAAYWRSLIETTGERQLEKVTQPLLILQGDADFQVYPDKDYTLWEACLADRENTVFHLYEGLNHLMMPTSGKRDTSEYETAGHVSEEVIADIAAFVQDTGAA
ncbi:MAG: alpha/beta fold hydrolase [Oscillospiraceae bacterium]|nr:alpha/beta fold hydrolase [Oscillospiraceae bacterium]